MIFHIYCMTLICWAMTCNGGTSNTNMHVCQHSSKTVKSIKLSTCYFCSIKRLKYLTKKRMQDSLYGIEHQKLIFVLFYFQVLKGMPVTYMQKNLNLININFLFSLFSFLTPNSVFLFSNSIVTESI